jgi:uncharacterized protein YoxC
MMQVTDWCAIAAVAAFVVLAAAAVRTLLAAHQTMRQASEFMDRFGQRLEETGEQANELLKKTEAIAADVHNKLQTLTVAVNSAREIGVSLSEVGGTVRQASKTLARSVFEVEQAVHAHKARVQEAMEWAATGVELWQRWQAGRRAHSERKEGNHA